MMIEPSFRERAMRFVLTECDITLNELLGHRKQRHLVEARALFVWLVRHFRPSTSYEAIGCWIDRHHSSVMNLHRHAVMLRLTNADFEAVCDRFVAQYRATMEVPYACA